MQRQNADKKKKIRQRKATTDTGICHTAKVVQGYQATAEALGSIAAFITENLTDFTPDNLTIEERFTQCFDKFPEARDELQKVTPQQCPKDVGAAARLLTTVHNLKTVLEVRAAKRAVIKGHTYDGHKFKKSSTKKRGKDDTQDDEDDPFKTPPAKRPCRSPPSTDSMPDPSSTASAAAASSTTTTASRSASSLPKAEEEKD